MAAEPVTASVFVEAPPARVYEYFTRPEAIVRWIASAACWNPNGTVPFPAMCAARTRPRP